MSPNAEPAVLDGLLDSFSRCLDAESSRRVVAFRISPEIQARIDHLAGLANEGQLDEAERVEYEAFINAADLIAVLRLKAVRLLAVESGP